MGCNGQVPAAPAVWQLRLNEASASQADTDVRCGQPFQLEVEALDKFGNRCDQASFPFCS